MASFKLTADSSDMAGWQYLVNWVLVVILGLAFVFYFARLVGYIISLLLKAILWKTHSIRITIEAFRVSPLGGRIMARNVVVSSADYTVSILRLNLTWRYWLLKMTRLPSYHFGQNSHDGIESPSKLTTESNSELPTSLLLHIDGLEVFMYNRTAAYEIIEETLRKFETSPRDEKSDPKNEDSSHSPSLSHRSSKTSTPETASASHLQSGSSAELDSAVSAPSQPSSLKILLQILPIQISVKRGAFVLGNHTTPSILMASFFTAKAVYDIGHAASKLDLYRTKIDLAMDRFQINMKPNITYDPDRYSVDQPASFTSKATAAFKATLKTRSLRGIFAQLRLKRRLRKARKSNQFYDWHGLKRYVGDSPQERVVELTDIEEYAKYSLILDSVATQLNYYYDVPGIQPRNHSISGSETDDSSPETGVDLVLSMATIHYGSWADRQRAPLQSLLFPALSRDSEATASHNEPGSLRKYAGFKIQLCTKNELIVRVPTREFSKDKEELATREDPKQKNSRPFGWIELKMAKGTKLDYHNSYVSSARGWPNTLVLEMANLEVRTSVTHGILFTADQHVIQADIGFPLKWNAECFWKFSMDTQKGNFFFLREHITFFTDLVSDFGSGPPTKFEYFRPFTYTLDWAVNDFSLHFNVNDHNIINDPLDFDSNKYVCFSGEKMDVNLKIPLKGTFASSSTIDYKVYASSLDIALEVPPWHTVSAFMNGSKKMGCTDAFEISGSYTYYNKVELDHNNLAVLNVACDNITLLFHGYFIRYLFALRDNYFGDFVNFVTFEEYILSEGARNGDVESNSSGNGSHHVNGPKKLSPEYWKSLKAENDLNIILTFKARDAMLVLPCQIYDHVNHLSVFFDSLDVDIHLCQFYMDLQADFSTASGYQVNLDNTERDFVFSRVSYEEVLVDKSPDIIMDTFSVHTHRMLGIDDLTYQCKWDFASDLISIDGRPDIFTTIDTFLDRFALGYTDLENSLTYQEEIVYDAAHFSFRCPDIKMRLKMKTPNTFLEGTIEGFLISFNDVANLRYSSRISSILPKLVLSIVDETGEAKFDAYLETSLHFTNFFQKLNMKEHRDKQQHHIKRNDATTHRAPFMLFEEEKDEMYQEAKGTVFSTVSLPTASFPLTEEYLFNEDQESDETRESFESFSDSPDETFSLNGEMHPTLDYLEDDFKPITGPDNEEKNDSFILKFEPIKGFLSPKGLLAISEMVLGAEELDIDMMLDKIQYETMKDLTNLLWPISMIDNVRFVSSSVDIKIVENSMESISSVFSSTLSVPVLSLAITEPSFVIQKSHSRNRLGSYLEESVSLSLAFHISDIYASISFPEYFSDAFSCQISDLEAWGNKGEDGESVFSLSSNATKVKVVDFMLHQSIGFAQRFSKALDQGLDNFKEASLRSDRWRGDLIYYLSTFAVTHKLLSDPEVLTKPARILRSEKDHVRFHEAWKIVTKLRSISREVPGDERRYNFKSEGISVPDNAYDKVKESFSRWREWEGNLKQRENFIKKVYPETEERGSTLNANFSMGSLELNVIGKRESSDYLAVSRINVSARKAPVSSTIGQASTSNEIWSEHFDLSVNIDAIDIGLGTALLSLVDQVNRLTGSDGTKSSENVKTVTNSEGGDPESEAFSLASQNASKSLSVLFNLNSLRCRLNFLKTYLELNLDGFTSSVIGNISPTAPLSFGWASELGGIDLSLGKNDARYLSFVVKQATVIASGVKADQRFAINLSSRSQEVDFKILDQKGGLLKFVTEFVIEDLGFIMKHFKPTDQRADVPHDDQPLNVHKLCLNFFVGKFSILIEALDPVKAFGSLTGASSKISISGTDCFGEYAHKHLETELSIRETPIARTKSSDFSFSTNITEISAFWLVKTNVNSDYFKVTTPSLLNALDSVLKHQSQIVEKVDQWKELADKAKAGPFKSGTEKPKKMEMSDQSGKPPRAFFFKFRWSQKYCGWFTYKDHTRFAVEFEDTHVSLGNFNGTTNVSSPVFGELIIPASRITVYDPSYSVGLSTLLDYNLSVKILDDSSLEGSEVTGRSLQIESEYFRVCLSTPVLLKVLEVSDTLIRKLDQDEGSLWQNSKRTENKVISETNKCAEHEDSPEIEGLVQDSSCLLTSIHVLSHNFCIGWVFEGRHKDYPGIILGAERIFAVTKADIGKLTVLGGFLSVANGTSASSFYSSFSEIDSLNRAFMPKVQLNYYVDGNKKLWIALKGDELDVRCMSNSTVLIERAMDSATQVRKYFDRRSERVELRRRNTADLNLSTNSKPTKSDPTSKSFNPSFKAIQCSVGFAGARIFFYKLQEDNLHEKPNSLTLQSPAVSIVVDYNYLKNVTRNHVLKAEVLMSQSDNTLYSSCVPVIEDFVHTFKNMFKTSSEKQDLYRKPERESKKVNLSTELRKMFQDTDLHIGVRIEKQRVSLSCEPTAKVAAVVEYDGASISACTGLGPFESVYVLGRVGSLSASLQHIYSDERSGVISVKKIILTSVISFKEDLEVSSSCCVEDIAGSVKMKQYQDVDLFSDIWFPGGYNADCESSSPEPNDIVSINSSSSLSSTQGSLSGLSVAVDFILSNIRLEVDFGSALGVMTLDLDKAWAISRKISSWSYEFQLGFSTLLVGSEGRLGGYLKLGKLYLNSTLDWKLEDMPVLDIPLVHMAAGFEEVQFKAIFDEHVFAFVNLKGWRFDVYNRKNGANISKDHLFVSIRYRTAEAFLTSLSASDFYDIYETISRMIEEKRTSYKEILRDSNKENFKGRALSRDLLEAYRKLDAQIEVFTGLTTIQVYPHSFHDSRVFMIQLDRSTANFTQSEYEIGISNQIELQLNNVKASFANTAGTSKEDMQKFEVDEMSEYALQAKGGLILGLPRFMISMRTYQKYQSTIVEYLFQSSFGGTVDIRWNLGSVNIVREMYAAHKRALLSRTEVPKTEVPSFRDDSDLSEIISQDSRRLKEHAEQEVSNLLSSPESSHKDFDQDIQQTMDKVTERSKFTYSALAPAIIEAPQLKELGNATPPLEWFGLHRNKFPNVTHQLAIVTLQKLIRQIEAEYSKTLERHEKK